MLKLIRLRGHSKEEICVARIYHSSWNGQCKCDLLCWSQLYEEKMYSTRPKLSNTTAGVAGMREMAVLQLSFVTEADDGDSL